MKVKSKYSKRNNDSIHVQIDRHDTWSLDSTLAPIHLASLLKFKEDNTGMPADFLTHTSDTTSNYVFDWYAEGDKEANDIAAKNWDDVLDKMIWAFFQLTINWEDQYYHGTMDFIWEDINQLGVSVKSIKDANPDGHWSDYEGLRLHEERIQEGLELFGKYYRNLWT